MLFEVLFFTLSLCFQTARPVIHTPRHNRSLTSFEPPIRCIINGDFNVHHQLWKSQTTHLKRTENLIPYLEKFSLQFLNEINHPTYHYRIGNDTSVIDLTFTTPHLQDTATNWAIDNEAATGSDHAVIRYQLVSETTLITDHSPSTRHLWEKANWETFTKRLQLTTSRHQHIWKMLHDNPSHENLDNSAEYLRTLIQDAIEEAVPVMRPCARFKRWWNDDI